MLRSCKSRLGPRARVLLAIWPVVFGLLPAWSAASESRLVVVLYPEASNGNPGAALADRAIRSTFARGSSESVEVHNEYLEVSRFPDPTYQQDLAGFLKRKYCGRKVDLVIAGLASALDFALAHRDEVFPQVPIVCLAVDHQEITSRELPPDVVGYPITMDLAASLDLALRLHPQTQHVFVVAGTSKFDSAWENKARAAFKPRTDAVEIEYLTGVPIAELEAQVARLPERSIIYYLHVFADRSGRVYTPADVVEALASKANAPIYSHVDSYLGRGIVGGRVFSFESAGNQAAQLGLRILSGEDPRRIGIQPNSKNANIFDGRQLRRWEIPVASLPADSEVRYRELTLWDQYKWHFAVLVSLICFQAVLIAGLLVQHARRTRAEERFRQAVDAAPNGMLMVGTDGRIVLVNKQMELIFGYPSEALVGQRVELLMPQRYRHLYPNLLREFFAHPQSRPIGAGRELWGLRKDGSEFPMEIGLSPLQTEAGPFVLASIVDISQRRRSENELHESREELRQLAGQILGAQETERRRIARELHDDFGQDLALLSVELDLLRQRPPAAESDARARMEMMSARVKQLSSSIHDLSHQLHPMKLEQLGLVAAIRGLCKELSRNENLRIEFTPAELPLAIPPDVALCLYRVTQEALRNVVKHSGASSATVTLAWKSDALCLEVCDNGAGFDPAETSGKGGLGLVSMRERLRLVGGELDMVAGIATGTRLVAQVPHGGSAAENVQSEPSAIAH